MAKLALAAAPPVALPRRFLLTAPLWCIAAGGLLSVFGQEALLSRWAPATLALVHAMAVGMLGNVMAGSLLQFLPAAAGVRVAGGVRAGHALHVLLNAGALVLVAGFASMRVGLLLPGAAILAAAFGLLAAMCLPGLARMAARGLLHAGIAQALLSLLVTVGVGIGLVLGLRGGGLSPARWTDVHAAFGLLGWVLGLVASVAGVVMPMFQGTSAPPARAQAGWQALVLLALLAVAAGAGPPARFGVAACVAGAAIAGLWLQWRARHVRNQWLVRFWRAGLVALLATAVALAAGASPVLVGSLALGIALPMLVTGMQLEIVAFLGWIGLHRTCPRGTRLPPVQRLLPEADKRRVFVAFLVAALVLAIAAAWPAAWTARIAGVLLVLAGALLLHALHGVGRRSAAFLRDAAC